MSAQVVLIVIGAVLVVVAIVGSGEYVQFKVPSVPAWGRVLLGILGCGVFALAFTPLVSPTSKSSSANRPEPPVSSIAPSASPLPSIDAASATLESPKSHTSVSRSQGFIATGRAASLGPDTVWILDFDGGYTVDEEATVVSGSWSAVDQQLGDSSDHLPFYLTMRAVLANTQCAGMLTQVESTSNDYTQNLPAGCKVIGQTTVKV